MKNDAVAIVLIENVWWDFKKNPAFASAEPFFSGLSRYNDSARCYRLTFYDESSFRKAIALALTVPEKRLVLHIGAHGENGKICGVSASKLLSHLAAIKRPREAEGIILSCCSSGTDEKAIQSAFGANIRWLFAYRSDVDWLGSTLIDTCVLEEVCLHNSRNYSLSGEKVIDVLASALTKFNPEWAIDEDRTEKPLRESIGLWIKPLNAKKPQEATQRLVERAWPVRTLTQN